MTKTDMATATEIARAEVRSIGDESGIEMVLLEDYTLSTKKGWVFFYDSKKLQRTGAFSDTIVGNCPIYVGTSGKITSLPTYQPVEESLKDIEGE